MASGPKSKHSFNPAKPPWSRLRTSLVNSKMQTENNAAFQTVNDLIQASEDFQSLINNQLNNIIASLNNEDVLPPDSLLGRGSFPGPVQNIFLGPGLDISDDNVLDVVNPGDFTFVINKVNDQDILNSAVLTDDLELWFNVLEFQCYYVELLLLYAGNSAAGDYKCNFVLPTADGWYRYIFQTDAAGALQLSTGIQLAAATALTADIIGGTDAALTARMAKLEMMFRCGLDGSVQFQFANNAAGADVVSRTYAGSVLKAKLLSGVPIGNVGAGGPGGGSGPGAGSNPPTVPFPNDLGTVQAYDAANPGQILTAETDFLFMNGVVAALQAVSPRYGFNGKRGNTSDPSRDAISYYHGTGSPTFGSNDVYVIDIILALGTPSAAPRWTNVTTPAAKGAWLPGPY